MSAAAFPQEWFAIPQGIRGDTRPGPVTMTATREDDDLMTRVPFPLSGDGRPADGAGVAPSIWDDLDFAGEADALAVTLRGLARLEDEVLSV